MRYTLWSIDPILDMRNRVKYMDFTSFKQFTRRNTVDLSIYRPVAEGELSEVSEYALLLSVQRDAPGAEVSISDVLQVADGERVSWFYLDPNMFVPFVQAPETTARLIAEYMVEHGTSHTISANYHFDFDEVNRLFGVNLPEDEKLVREIESAVWKYHGEKVAELNIEGDFDFLFWLNDCPNAEE